MGLGFVIFLPLVGIVGLLVFVGRWLARLAERALREAAEILVPNWVPGVSYLVRGRRGAEGRGPESQKPLPEALDRSLVGLEQEVVERRRRGEK